MNEQGEQYDEATSDRDELGLSTGLMEWFEGASRVIEGRLVSGPGSRHRSTPLSGFQVELPSRRWLMEGLAAPRKMEEDGSEPSGRS